MTGDLRQAPLGARTVSVQLRAELAHVHKLLLSQNWGSMWCSMFTTITRDNTPNASKCENEWRTNNLLGRSQNGYSDYFSNFSYARARGYAIREGSAANRPATRS